MQFSSKNRNGLSSMQHSNPLELKMELKNRKHKLRQRGAEVRGLGYRAKNCNDEMQYRELEKEWKEKSEKLTYDWDKYHRDLEKFKASLSTRLRSELESVAALKSKIKTYTEKLANLDEKIALHSTRGNDHNYDIIFGEEKLRAMPKIDEILHTPRYLFIDDWDTICDMLAEDLKKHDELFDKKSKEVEELTEAEKEEFTELHDLLFDKDGTSRARWAVRSRDAATKLKPLLDELKAERQATETELNKLKALRIEKKEQIKRDLANPSRDDD